MQLLVSNAQLYNPSVLMTVVFWETPTKRYFAFVRVV